MTALACVGAVFSMSGSALAQEAGTGKPAERPAETKPAETKPAETKPAEEPPADNNDRAWETAPHEHRGGFAMGLSIGGGVGAANGFPNDAKKIGRAAYYTESGLGFTSASSFWLGGALADWLTFGIGVGYSMILNGETRSTTPLMQFHTDVYPLYMFGGPLRDLGAVFEVGLGFPQTIDIETEEVLIDGTSSFVMAGAVWEGIKAWKLRFGPMVAGHYMWSETLRRPALILGFRGTLYTSP